MVESECDVSITYTHFNHGQWELIEKSIFGTKSSNAWRTEGIAVLNQGTTTVAQDKRVDIRDARTMQDLLDELASRLVEIVGEHFRPTNPPPKR